MDKEIWKSMEPIGYKGYLISDKERVYNNVAKRIIGDNGSGRVSLIDDKIGKRGYKRIKELAKLIFPENYEDEYKDEIFESLKSLGFANYVISKNGIVKNIKLNIYSNYPLDSGGYKLVSLADGIGYSQQLRVHILVAKTFIPNPENKLTVDHINRNREDPRMENLRWADRTEQAQNREVNREPRGRAVYQLDKDDPTKILATWKSIAAASRSINSVTTNIWKAVNEGRIYGGFGWIYCDKFNPKEMKWKTAEIKGYRPIEVSDMGYIRIKGDYISTGSKAKTGYMTTSLQSLTPNKKDKGISVHQLVALAHLGPAKGRVVNHKNSIRDDNRLDNLEYCTYSENKIHAMDMGNVKMFAVNQYDKCGKYLKSFKSLSEAARESGVCLKTIHNACKDPTEYHPRKKFIWRFKDQVEDGDLDIKIRKVKKRLPIKADICLS